MSRNTKIILVVLGLLGLCCVGTIVALLVGGLALGRVASNAVSENPAQAAEIGRSILNYQLPPGYREQASMSLLGNQVVFIGPAQGEGGMFIMLARFMAGTAGNEESIRQSFQDSFSRRIGAGGVAFTPVDSRNITINGVPTTLNISEGNTTVGRTLRQATAVFNVGSSVGLVTIIGSVDGWDEGVVNAFLNSIR